MPFLFKVLSTKHERTLNKLFVGTLLFIFRWLGRIGRSSDKPGNVGTREHKSSSSPKAGGWTT